MSKFTTTVQHVFHDDEGNSVKLEFAPAEHIEPRFEVDLNGCHEIVYAIHDTDTEQPYTDDDGNGVEWHGFDTKEEAAHFCHQAVEEFGLGTVHRFRADTHGPVGRNVLDPEGTNVLLLDNDWAPEGREELAQSILDEFTAWQNGETYAIVRQSTSMPYGQADETEIVGGYIGTEHVQELVSKGGDW